MTVSQTTGHKPGIRRSLKILEAIAWTVALVLLADAAWRYVDGVIGRRVAMQKFSEVRDGAKARPGPLPVDQTLWSQARIAAFASAITLPSPTPLAVLRIPQIHLEVPVLEGTDDVTLDRGLGHIADTAAPGGDGNVGIAGHRDGFFRGLKDVSVDDTIELETLHGTDAYRIDRTWIVEPDDVSVLDPTPTRAITLVTCYPFYFVGSAPQRFIVRAVSTGPAASQPSRQTELPPVRGRALHVVRDDGLLGSSIDR